ncbi:hypothetical protein HanPSC8_Chr11g0497831 [Helianthus annuus]|nr:hypothetical protein HanPSC8_Chr11g0497831 [Helianthus annuus]
MEAFRCAFAQPRTALIRSKGRLRVGLTPGKKSGLSFRHILFFPGPRLKGALFFVASSENTLGYISTLVDVVGSIYKNLGLDNGDQTVLLADDGVSG